MCRSDPTVQKHAGLTAFMFPMDSPGVEVRPLRQMSGGSSFNEVFLTGVEVPDSGRLGDVRRRLVGRHDYPRLRANAAPLGEAAAPEVATSSTG
jgi:alkylation response protein AidB-like acyl-CoA dehydrogenase